MIMGTFRVTTFMVAPFRRGTHWQHLKFDLLRDQYGLPAADRRNLMKKLRVKSRSVFISNVYPNFIIGGGVVRLLS